MPALSAQKSESLQTATQHSRACFRFQSVAGFILFVVALMGLPSCRQEPAVEVPQPPLKAAGPTLEFEMLERSDHPGHKSSEYADCLYTARLRMLDPSVPGEPKVVMGAIPAFLGRQLQTGSAVRPGDRIRAVWVPFDKAPENYRRMQTADRFGDYLLDYYLLTDVEIVATKQVGEVVHQPTERITPVIPPDRFIRGQETGELADLRKARMEREKARIDGLVQANGGSWEAWMKQLRPAFKKLQAIASASKFAARKDHLYFNRLPYLIYSEMCEDEPHTGPLGALRLLNAELQRRGIDLIAVPFPTKEDVNAGRFADLPDESELNPQRLRFHRLLLENDIEVVDLAPALRAALKEYPYVYFDNRDVHPADGGIQVAGREIAKLLRDYGLGVEPAHQVPVEDAVLHVTQEVPGFVLGSKYPATRVLFPNPPTVPAGIQRRVIFQGDSFLHVPTNFVAHATVADHVGRYLGFEPETALKEGGANLILQDLARAPKERLEGRQVLVFVFGPTRLRSPRSGLARPDYEWHQALLPQ